MSLTVNEGATILHADVIVVGGGSAGSTAAIQAQQALPGGACMANDGIVDQRSLLAYAENSFAMLEELDRWGGEVPEDGERRLRRQEGPPQRQVRAADARGATTSSAS